jgi:RHS repeat-associated protein
MLNHGPAGVNRTLPDVSPPASVLRFTATPADAEFLHAGVFLEPLVPVAATTAAENRDLAEATLSYRDLAEDGANRDSVEPLLKFLASHPESAWKPALELNLGIIYRQTGHFSKALAIWQEAWSDTQKLTDRNGRALGDATIARLTQFEAYLGRKEVLQPLLDEVRDRPVRGSASQVLTSSREGLFHMIARPDRSFKCGPIALSRILLRDHPTPSPEVMQVFEEAQSTPNGMSLAAVQQVSVKAGMNYQMAYRTPGAPIITPAVAHWKVGHYAAIETSDTARYTVEDPTFGETIRVSSATLDEEASGYFLVPQGALPAGWRSVTPSEGETIWGRGDTGNNKDQGATGPTPCPPSGGCTTWSVQPMVVGLELHDAPVGYRPPLGPEVTFDLYYAHRDSLQPQTFSYVNFGPKWTFTWLSYVTDNVGSSAAATLYGRGGGSEPFTFSSTSAATSELGPFSQSTLTRNVGPTGASTGFTRRMRDGSSEQFNLAVGNQFFMTAVVDRFGNKVSLHYDSQMRIVALSDAIGQVSTLTYGLASDPLKVTRITDPFGRSASFTYNASGQLSSITDTLGITSSYVYGTADFISNLTTPYGTTVFSYGDATTNPNLGDKVFLKVTDPLNRTSYAEFNQTTTPIDVNAKPPTGMVTCSCYLVFRNTFIFDPNQYRLATAAGGLDYSKAHLIHWLHTSDLGSTARVMESEKQPLESRVWYNYPGQPSSITFGTSASGVSAQGSSGLPTAIGRVLDNGTTQLQTFAYNAYGNPTQSTDPVGRQMTYRYAANGIDLVSIANTTSGSQPLATMTYNGQHEPLTMTGANGATAQYRYNLDGQPVQYTDQLGHITTMTYAGGYLQTVQGPLAGATYNFTYDKLGRIASATDPAGSTVSYTYDAADRPTSATFPDGTTSQFAYSLLDLVKTTDRLGQVTTMSYDADRELSKIIDPLGQTVTLGYSVAGILDSLTDQNGHTTTMILDGQNRMVAKKYADGSEQQMAYAKSISLVTFATDALKQSTAYAYNADNTPVSISYLSAINPTAYVSFQYDPAYVRPMSMTDGIGTTTYTYYPVTSAPALGANQLQSVTSPIAGATSGTDVVSYTYDALNRVVGRTINGAAQTTSFDPLGRVTAMTNPLDAFSYGYVDATPRLTSLTSNHGPKLAMSYFGPIGDELLQQMTFTAQSGIPLSQFGYTYNADDNVTSFTESYLNQNPAIIAATGNSSNFAQSLMTSVIKGGGAGAAGSIHHGFAALAARDVVPVMVVLLLSCLGWVAYGGGRRWRLAWAAAPAAMLLIAVGCSGDAGTGSANRSQSMSVSAEAPVEHRAAPPSSPQVTHYAYDMANRLVSALVNTSSAPTPPSPQFAYGYDRASNLTSIMANAPTQSPTYTTTNELTSASYDANGSPSALGSASYTWDGANRVITFRSGFNRSQFTYDGLNRLVRIIDQQNGRVVADHAYFWCGNERCLEHDNTQSGSPVSKQYFAQGVIAAGKPYYYVADRLGSVRQLVSVGGEVEAQYDYDPYGNQAKISGSANSDFGYAGYFHHAASGLNFALYRAYDSAHARWLNRDPIEEAGGVNLYAYAQGDAPSETDVTGLDASNANCVQGGGASASSGKGGAKSSFALSGWSLANSVNDWLGFIGKDLPVLTILNDFYLDYKIAINPNLDNLEALAKDVITPWKGWEMGQPIGNFFGNMITHWIAVRTDDPFLEQTINPSWPIDLPPSGRSSFGFRFENPSGPGPLQIQTERWP